MVLGGRFLYLRGRRFGRCVVVLVSIHEVCRDKRQTSVVSRLVSAAVLASWLLAVRLAALQLQEARVSAYLSRRVRRSDPASCGLGVPWGCEPLVAPDAIEDPALEECIVREVYGLVL